MTEQASLTEQIIRPSVEEIHASIPHKGARDLLNDAKDIQRHMNRELEDIETDEDLNSEAKQRRARLQCDRRQEPRPKELGMSRGDLHRRLEKLQASARSGPSGGCPECGLGPQETGYIVLCGNDPAEHLPEVCAECGRTTKIHIRVVYEGEWGRGS